MNKIKTLGISALAGSLVALSAQAGDLSVSGSANISYTSKEKGQAVSNPIGIANALTFSKSGELDNGWTWAGAVIYLGGADVIGNISTSHVTFTMGDMGTLMIGNNAEAIGSIDDVMPTAYEESWNGLDSGPALVGMGNGNMVTYTTPDLGAGTNLVFTWDPASGGGADTEGGVSTGGGDSVLEAAFKSTGLIEGLTIGGGVAEENKTTDSSTSANFAYTDKPWEITAYAKYAVGGVTIGYQESAEDPGRSQLIGAQQYENNNLAISFQVNDDLTISYSDFDSLRQLNDDTTVTMDIDSIQASYSMGAASIRIQDTDSSNANYTTGTDEEHTEINVSLSF